MENKMVTTGLDLPGYEIVESLGKVQGLTVRTRNMFSDIGAGFRSIVGGKVGAYVKLCEDAREEAFIELEKQVRALGADAVIGFRYGTSSIGQGMTEFLAYGTAVRVKKIEE